MRIGRLRVVMTVLAVVVVLPVMPANASHQDTIRLSVTSAGMQAGGSSTFPSISADGRLVAFVSEAADLVSGDTNGSTDVFVRDRTTGQTTRVSVATGGAQAVGGNSFDPSISADGRYVSFTSAATNLVSGDTNGVWDVFVRDLQTGETTRVSVATGGAQASGALSYQSSISADGRYVAFTSYATGLVSGDTNGFADVFVHDRQTGATTRVSVATGAVEAAGGHSISPSISGDARLVAFQSDASNLVSGDTNGAADVFVHDLQTGVTSRVSVATGGAEANNVSGSPSISADGRHVAFESYATDLVSGDTNGDYDIFVRDRQNGTTERASVATGGGQASGSSNAAAISADGRYVAFISSAADLVVGDTNGETEVFVRDLQNGETTRVSLASGNAEATGGTSYQPAVSGDGRYVAFASDAVNLVSGDTNGEPDVFLRYLPPEGVVRTAGADRYATAAAVSQHSHPFGADVVYVAVGSDFPDALAAGPAAAAEGAPLLLVQTGSIPAATSAELTRLAPSEIVIVGGTGVISNAVETQLGAYAATVTRLAGADRYATAAAIAQRVWPSTSSTVFLAVGDNFPDALAAGPAAAHLGAPLLLVRTDSIPGATAAQLARLSPTRIVIAGGTGVVSSTVESELGSYAGTVTRLAGVDRYETASAIAEYAWISNAPVVYVAVGDNFPDALAASPAIAHFDGPLLLVRTNSIPAATATELTRLDPSEIVVAGGSAVVSDSVATQLAGYLP